jgi:hypothetical protein
MFAPQTDRCRQRRLNTSCHQFGIGLFALEENRAVIETLAVTLSDAGNADRIYIPRTKLNAAEGGMGYAHP